MDGLKYDLMQYAGYIPKTQAVVVETTDKAPEQGMSKAPLTL